MGLFSGALKQVGKWQYSGYGAFGGHQAGGV